MVPDDALEDPTDWPAEFTHLRQLDQQLRCPICKEYLTTAMVATNCGHTFCSLCVRRCLNQDNICPSCRAPLTESELHPNRLVDGLLRTFRSGRQQLLDLLAAKPADLSGAAVESCKRCRGTKITNSADEQRKRQRICTRSMAKSSSQAPLSSAADYDIDLTTSDIEGIATSDIDSMPKDDGTVTMDDDSDFEPSKDRAHEVANRVPCPNCGSGVRQSQINWHLDRCLAGKLAQAPQLSTKSLGLQGSEPVPTKTGCAKLKLHPQPIKFTLPRPTKLAYSLLSESKLRRTLKDLGIPSKGDKQQMQARHVEWVNMYMANADAETPVSHKALLKRLAAWEDALNRPAEHSKSSTFTPDAVADHSAKYADAFAELVAQARAGRQPAPSNDPAVADT
ncbi:E3 ubiquitin-protein ligase rad18 [Coemansia sp. RSA 2706]|nr:E3 ubiquitin-protein ligase rad18 [Coemansia sp. RSA 2706]KAJ2321569.1 E3 ubiquitin-protein ligase rad18 [Coemansia sp. RSA 2704]KAJ2367044.1 E3 ubiquitin-protein ligase rad18 [Coemansia sp. RSA 2610]KAJ2739874.1 E3 ubiquitin-protein ligase rad18 [Coemansia sp. Cherry 401B]